MVERLSDHLLNKASEQLRSMGVSERVISSLEQDINKTVQPSKKAAPSSDLDSASSILPASQRLPKDYKGVSGTVI